jgi:ERCC4-related helicase
MTDPISAVGQYSGILLGLNVTAEPGVVPPRMLLTYQYKPDGELSRQVVFGQTGVNAMLGVRVQLEQRVEDKGAYSFVWTDVNQAGFRDWAQQIVAGGFNPSAMERLVNNMDAVKVSVTKPTPRRVSTAFGATPPNMLLEIPDLEQSPAALWDGLKNIPGTFFKLPSGKAMPISGSFAEEYIRRRGIRPSPVYVPTIHVDELATLLPSIAVQRNSLRREIGLDYMVYGPEYFPIPMLNPATNAPYMLYPFQAEAVSKFLAMRRTIVSLSVGTGKTLISATAAEALFRMGRIDRCVIIGPKGPLRQVWQKELKKYYNRNSMVIEGDPKERKARYTAAALKGAKYILTSYDSWRLMDAHSHLAQLLGPRTMVVIDEVHHLKHEQTKRHRFIRELLDGVRLGAGGMTQYPALVTDYRMFLTGTLAHDKPVDVYGPIQLLGFHVFNTEDEFQRLYFEREIVRTSHIDRRTGQASVKQRVVKMNPQRVASLRHVIDAVAYAKTTEEVNIQLPPLTKQQAVIEPTEHEMLAYRVIKSEIETLFTQVVAGAKGPVNQSAFAAVQQNLLATMSMERQFSCDPALLLLSKSPTALDLQRKIGPQNLMSISPGSKMRTLLSWLGKVLREPVGKVVVFTTFERLFVILQALFQRPPASLEPEEREGLEMVKRCCLFYHGGMTNNQRNETLNKFQYDNNMRVLFSTDAGGEGLNLQDAGAQFVVHYDSPFSLGAFAQREGRVYRQGQKQHVFVLSLVFAPEEETKQNLSVLSLKLNASRYIDPRLKALLVGKGSEVLQLLG